MNWNDTDKVETIEGFLEMFANDIKNDPQGTIDKFALELETLYVRFDNDQEGRGILGDSSIMGQINAMEAVRAECIKLLKERGEWPPKLVR